MSAELTAPLAVTPRHELEQVAFDQAMEARIADLLGRYPTKKAALLPLLWLCQDRWGWISPGVMRAVADRLELAPAEVEGVVTFYTMYRPQPPGKYVLQVCSTLSCQLCGAAALIQHLKRKLGIEFGQTSADGRFTLVDVQCLGACGEGPVVQMNDDYHTRLTVEELDRLLDGLR